MKEIHYPVLVHSCMIDLKTIPAESLMREERYLEVKKMKKVKDFGKPLKLGEAFVIEERDEVESVYYLKLPKSCRCRKYVSKYEADQTYVSAYAAQQLVSNGNAMCVFKLLARGLVKDENQIWMPAQGRVPRVDLISRADIERAFIGSEKKSKHFKFNRITNRFDVVAAPEGITRFEWEKQAEDEVRFERRIRQQYKKYIDECHKVTMGARAALTKTLILSTPWEEGLHTWFSEDPHDGRTIFAFGPDMRTWGGHF